MMERLRDVLPTEALWEHEGPHLRLLDEVVVAVHRDRRWPGSHRNVRVWWELENGKAVGWNENPSRGWSFPVVRVSG